MKKVLIIEDHADIRKLLRMTLAFEDYDIYEACDGDSGMAMAKTLQPDVMLVDVMMPGLLNGLDVCRQTRGDALLQNTDIIMLTARGQCVDREAGMAAGANAYLVKPFSTLQVLETLRGIEEAR